jgi:hypothetical protein
VAAEPNWTPPPTIPIKKIRQKDKYEKKERKRLQKEINKYTNKVTNNDACLMY